MNNPQVFKKEEMLPVSKVCRLIPGRNGGPCSRQHVYNLIDEGVLAPAFRFGGRYNVQVPRSVVMKYLEECRISPGE